MKRNSPREVLDRKSLSLKPFLERQDVLRQTLTPLLDSLPDDETGGVVADLIDIYDISAVCIDRINQLANRRHRYTAGELGDLLTKLEIELFMHMPFHQKSLKRPLGKMLKILDNFNDGDLVE